jgi:hypothetical protein
MNPIIRILRNVRNAATGDTAFESYYGSIVRRYPDGAPNAAEARRDYDAVRSSIERVSYY